MRCEGRKEWKDEASDARVPQAHDFSTLAEQLSQHWPFSLVEHLSIQSKEALLWVNQAFSKPQAQALAQA
jgi:hypothetical protein